MYAFITGCGLTTRQHKAPVRHLCVSRPRAAGAAAASGDLSREQAEGRSAGSAGAGVCGGVGGSRYVVAAAAIKGL